MNAKILEIFHSIQGEGKYAGVPQVFVRFFECNMHCFWCDTPHSIGDGKREYTEYSQKELFSRIQPWFRGIHSVSLTGGEPLVQKDFILEFIPLLKESRTKVYLETNGILYKELESLIKGIDIIAMDIKLPSSTKCQPFWVEHETFLKVSRKKDVFVKTVVTADTAKKDIERCVEIIESVDPGVVLFLQPNHFEIREGALERCLRFQEYCSRYLKDVRVLPQVHKFIKMK